MSDRATMSILEHLAELRDRLLRAIIALAVGVVVGTLVTPRVLKFLVAPLGDQVPIAIAPTETPAVYFKVSIVIGLVIGMPVIVYQLFRFVAPGLQPNERRYMLVGAPIAAISFAAGVAFAALVLIPAAMPFLRGFLADIVEQRYSINRYVSFVSTVMLWAGLVFETPLVMFFLAKLGVATPRGFAKARRVVVIGAAAGAAVITPTTDPINMLLIMGPFLLLYELGILLARLA
ncbi:MAG: twin-arginine translocase subunit TatC [Anaerolineae bacterium]|jgi:sec-independent protein translocase protein TatC